MANKKSVMTLTAIVEIILAIVLFLIAFAACTAIKNGFSNNDDKYIASFQDFVKGINDMTNPRKEFKVEVKKGSAIIGFRKEGVKWECGNCNPTRSFNKPANPQCDNNACACLCLSGLKFENNLGKCDSPLICRSLEERIIKNIKMVTILESSNAQFDATDKYWKNGFMFANDIGNSDGLPRFRGTQMQLFIDNNNGIVSVCNAGMRRYNKQKFSSDSCITPPPP